MHHFHNALELTKALKPDQPVTLIRPHAAQRAARYFVDNFPGKSLYAVKANPSEELLLTLWHSGITHFDVASIVEVRLIARLLPDAVMCFMHPVKPEGAIKEAYHQHGVRVFSLDSLDELEKINRATENATDIDLCVRVRVSSEHAELSLASKFGADGDEIAELLVAARQRCDRLGVCFHVGSQAMSPHAYVQAIDRVRSAIADASVTVDIVNVGGGFPSVYPDMEPPSLRHYFEVIDHAFEDMPISYSAELWCEPGRALCAEYSSLLVRVDRRRGTELYINDGAYGALFDAAHLNWRFPVKQISGDTLVTETTAFSFYGPTCDDLDHMTGPFFLPDSIGNGDYIEIGMIGAYGAAMRTGFNGFGEGETAIVSDEPMDSLYVGARLADSGSDNVVSIQG